MSPEPLPEKFIVINEALKCYANLPLMVAYANIGILVNFPFLAVRLLKLQRQPAVCELVAESKGNFVRKRAV